MMDDPKRETWDKIIIFFDDLDLYKDFCTLIVKPVSESIYAHHFFATQTHAAFIISVKHDRMIAPQIIVDLHASKKTVDIQFFDFAIDSNFRRNCKTQISCSYQDAWSQLEKVLAEMMIYSDFNTESK